MSCNDLTIAVAVNDINVLWQNLFLSPDLSNGLSSRLVIREGYPSASLAYNTVLDESESDIVIFVHQDVFLLEGFFPRLKRWISYLEDKEVNWGVLGCFGSKKFAEGGVGSIFTTGMGVHGKEISEPEPVETLDEILLVVRKSSGLRFDQSLPHFHLYGTDICLAARDKGMSCYVVPGFCIHNTNQILSLPDEFYECYDFLKKKWKKYLPIYTSCVKISRFDEELLIRSIRSLCAKALGRKKTAKVRLEDPRTVLGNQAPEWNT